MSKLTAGQAQSHALANEASAMNTRMADSQKIQAERLRARMRDVGIDQSELARRVESTQGAISLILSGKTKNSRLYPRIAQVLSVNLGWLMGATDKKIEMRDINGNAIADEELPDHYKSGEFRALRVTVDDAVANNRNDGISSPAEDVVPVRELDLTFGMGATYMDVPVTETARHFSRDWLRQYTRADPKNLLFAQGAGDSMAPTLQDSDLMLIDCSQRSLNISDKIWAIAWNNCGAIKRLRPINDGGVEIMSDNPTVKDAVAYDDEMHILGRVVAIVRKV